MRVYETKWFARFARRESIADSSLREAVERAEAGLIDASLGGGVIKQRLARKGKGRSGGYRVLLALRRRERAIFLYGFAKSDRANITDDELETLRELAEAWLAADDGKIAHAIEAGSLAEVKNEN